MQRQYRGPAVRTRKRKIRRSKYGGAFSLPIILICIAFLALFIGIAALSHIGAKEDREVSGFAFDGKVTVFVDPGHGYDDPGALSDYTGGLYEKDINLAFAKSLAEKLEELGYEVIMTRDSDIPAADMEPDSRGLYTLDPNERVDLTNKSGADLFISLHCNITENSANTAGTQIYYCSENSPESEKYAELLCDTLRADMSARRCDTKDTRASNSFAVIRDTDIPSVLVEMGFISSPDDSALLCDPDWQDEFTSSLANGISRYIAANSEE